VAYLGLAGSRLGGGRTAGKTFADIRVVGADGQPLGVGRALLRASVLTAPWFSNNVQFRYGMPFARVLASLAGTLILGVVPASIALHFASGRRQFLHDVVARSFVVVGEEKPSPAGPPRWSLVVAALWILGVSVAVLMPAVRGGPRLEDPLLSALRRIPRVSSARVGPMDVFQSGQHYRALYVTVATGLGGEDPATVIRSSAAAVVAFYPQLNEFQAIRVENRTGFDVGLASWSAATVELRTPAEWRALVEPEVGELLSGRVK
jgi:hypothetical protein